jgi:UDP-N-acetylmuramate--alanine ligase
MSGIAELLLGRGYQVSGSDVQRTDITERLASMGARIAQGHDAGNVGDAEVVVYSSAVKPANPELVAARERGLPALPRAEILAELMQLQRGIAVAGAHGKTTTTAMIALALDAAGLDPTAVIGGWVGAFESNARLGRGQYFVAEADESDRSFLFFKPHYAVITNIDREHMEAYRTFDDLRAAFLEFANGVSPEGAVVLCTDDAHLDALRPSVKRRTITYGLTESADVTATDIALQGFGSASTVRRRQPDGRVVELGLLRLSVPGRHNIQNALAAVALASELGIAWSDTASALEGFYGADRRFQRRGDARGVVVVEDYGHHPTEIATVVATARSIAEERLIVVFQPHRYSRTQMLMSEFGAAFAGADVLVLTDVYSAGEDPIAGVDVDALAAMVRQSFRGDLRVIKPLAEVAGALAGLARAGDMIVLLGAGSIGSIAPAVLHQLEAGI